jgi:hypothetical protein
MIAKDLLGREYPSHRVEAALKAYFTHYISVVCPSAENATVILNNPVLKSHDDVLKCFSILCANPTFDKIDFMARAFRESCTLADKEHALMIVVKACLMTEVSSKEYASHSLRGDAARVEWGDSQKILGVLAGIISLR